MLKFLLIHLARNVQGLFDPYGTWLPSMSSNELNCTKLVTSLLESNINSKDGHVETHLYMDEFFGSFLDFKLLNDPVFSKWANIIAVFILLYSVFFSCIYFPCHMAEEKRFTLWLLENREPLTRSNFLKLLDKHTNGQRVISILIAEYTNPRVIHVDNLEDSLTLSCGANVACKSIIYLLSFIIIGTLLYVMYVPIFMMNAFTTNSVEHYLKTECTYSWCTNCGTDPFVNLFHSAVAPRDQKRCTDCTDCSIARCSAMMLIAVTSKYEACSWGLRHFWNEKHMRTCFLCALRHLYGVWKTRNRNQMWTKNRFICTQNIGKFPMNYRENEN